MRRFIDFLSRINDEVRGPSNRTHQEDDPPVYQDDATVDPPNYSDGEGYPPAYPLEYILLPMTRINVEYGGPRPKSGSKPFY